MSASNSGEQTVKPNFGDHLETDRQWWPKGG